MHAVFCCGATRQCPDLTQVLMFVCFCLCSLLASAKVQRASVTRTHSSTGSSRTSVSARSRICPPPKKKALYGCVLAQVHQLSIACCSHSQHAMVKLHQDVCLEEASQERHHAWGLSTAALTLTCLQTAAASDRSDPGW